MRIIVSGGGSGGHIYPALSLIEYIQRVNPTAEFLYVGMKNKMEGKIVPALGIPFKHIAVKGLRGKLTLQNVQAASLLTIGVFKARKIIREFKPDIVIGTGGYVSAPVVYAASKLGIATAVYDADRAPGKANKFLAKYTDHAFVSFNDAVKRFPFPDKVVVSGNPRATSAAFYAEMHKQEQHKKKRVLVLGGSLGAQNLNNAMLEMLKQAHAYEYDFTFVTGERYYDEVMAALPKVSDGIQVLPFIDNALEALHNADLVISRSGATTLAEIAALHKPAILIPSPNVTNGEQLANAQLFVDAGAALLIEDAALNADLLWSTIKRVLQHHEQYILMESGMATLSQPQAAAIIYDTMVETMKQK